ncbi:cobalt-precorrin-6B (C15)-methyltransferase CbiT [Cyanobacterium sp. HL-69]|uniref:precorrin-6Y C5,15-methyltransferase subunit CbiT n=1 Tax=Cyanobacterium sp. HL-69 TaxID=2054282 RepID=UPI000CA1A416|nr:cobalt-precorrin-6B (C15)-methyltransferase CbiT [Cyanobacterium sp. HL-69]
MVWKYKTSGIPDELFERLPGIPLTKREVRLLILSALRLEDKSVIWDIGAGTGTVSIEMGLLCPQSEILAIERDPEIVSLIKKNSKKFKVTNVTVMEGCAPDCLGEIKSKPDRVFIGGSKSVKAVLTEVWDNLQGGGRVVAIASNLENLYQLSEGLAQLHARNIEVVQSSINRLETRGISQVFAAIAPVFILSGEKI